MSESGWEYVRSSRRQRSYFRRVPWCRKNPTLPMRKVRYALGKLAHEKAFGTTGMVLDGEREIPSSAHVIKKHMEGRKFAPSPAPRIPEVLERLKPAFEAIGAQVSGMKPINSSVIPLLLQWQRLRKEEEERKPLSLKKKRVL